MPAPTMDRSRSWRIHLVSGGAVWRASCNDAGVTASAKMADCSRPRWRPSALGVACSNTPRTARLGRPSTCRDRSLAGPGAVAPDAVSGRAMWSSGDTVTARRKPRGCTTLECCDPHLFASGTCPIVRLLLLRAAHRGATHHDATRRQPLAGHTTHHERSFPGLINGEIRVVGYTAHERLSA